jgi:Zinc finger C-x8-C-x5-C-x3-H type (and similar)
MEDAKDASDAVRDVSYRPINTFIYRNHPNEHSLPIQQGSGVIVDGREIKVEVATGVRGSGSRGGNAGKSLSILSVQCIGYSRCHVLPSTGACYDFQRGQCSRGGSCKFSHDGEDRNGGGGGK